MIGACNLRCPHCYGPPKTAAALPLQSLAKLITRFKKLGSRRIVLTGGEPLLVPEIETVFWLLRKAGFKVALSTNGTYFWKHQETIEASVESLNLPLDGSTADIHSISRHDAESYENIINILQYFKDNPGRKPPQIRVGTVFSRANSEDFMAMSDMLARYSDIIATWKIYELIDIDIQSEQRASLLHQRGLFEDRMDKLMASTRFKGRISISPIASRDRAYFMVNPQGMVVVPTDIGGRTLDVLVGDMLQDSLTEIVARWNGHVNSGNYYENHRKHYSAV